MSIAFLGDPHLTPRTPRTDRCGPSSGLPGDQQYPRACSPSSPSVRRTGGRTILVIDDDEGTRQTFEVALRLKGFNVTTAASGADGIRAAIRPDVDLVFLDLNLGDIPGLDVIRTVRDARNPRFVVISGFLSVGTVVESMKLGALDVIEKPVDVDNLVRVASEVLGESQESAPANSARRVLNEPRSVAERWVGYVIKGCAAKADFKTLDCWARETAVSYSTLCAICRIVGIRPLDARDFTRVLRALRKASAHRCAPELFLDVSDERTVRTLSSRANVNLESEAGPASAIEFLTHQRLVPSGHQVLHMVRTLLQDEHAAGPLFDRRPAPAERRRS